MARQYEFRPAKAAQRQMIVDACRRLTAITSLDEYQYVGFGGLEFIDFVEFHRGLGIPHPGSTAPISEARCTGLMILVGAQAGLGVREPPGCPALPLTSGWGLAAVVGFRPRWVV